MWPERRDEWLEHHSFEQPTQEGWLSGFPWIDRNSCTARIRERRAVVEQHVSESVVGSPTDEQVGRVSFPPSDLRDSAWIRTERISERWDDDHPAVVWTDDIRGQGNQRALSGFIEIFGERDEYLVGHTF